MNGTLSQRQKYCTLDMSTGSFVKVRTASEQSLKCLSTYFGDKVLQAIECTGTDNQTHSNQEKTCTHTQENTKKTYKIQKHKKLTNPKTHMLALFKKKQNTQTKPRPKVTWSSSALTNVHIIGHNSVTQYSTELFRLSSLLSSRQSPQFKRCRLASYGSYNRV